MEMTRNGVAWAGVPALPPFKPGHSRGKKAVPSDYEVCGVCGFDHVYDFPYLSRAQMAAAAKAHRRERT
jgi:hypothetical protein